MSYTVYLTLPQKQLPTEKIVLDMSYSSHYQYLESNSRHQKIIELGLFMLLASIARTCSWKQAIQPPWINEWTLNQRMNEWKEMDLKASYSYLKSMNEWKETKLPAYLVWQDHWASDHSRWAAVWERNSNLILISAEAFARGKLNNMFMFLLQLISRILLNQYCNNS